jgi:phage antirepressor YoqD-like protein
VIKKITKMHKYAILWLHSNNTSVEDICKELKVTEHQVNKVLSPIISNNVKPTIKENKQNITSKDMMIMESSGGMHRVSVMTQAASENNDFHKQSLNTRNTKTYEHIYKPNK